MNKYRNIKTAYKNINFDSKKEMNRYVYLKDQERKRMIVDLELQKRFVLQESFKHEGQTYRKIEYVCDFYYYDGLHWIIEDVKSDFTRKNPVYRIKKKLLLKQLEKEHRFIET